jgi:hypothetical protein
MGDSWLFPDPQVSQLPIRVVWSMRVEADWIDVLITGINRFPIRETVRLFPFDGTLDVWVFNSPAEQIPTELPPRTSQDKPGPREPVEHFACYYTLTDSAGPVPFYEGAQTPEECFQTFGEPGLDVMCIAAQALPQP